jgi:hypothetical protein
MEVQDKQPKDNTPKAKPKAKSQKACYSDGAIKAAMAVAGRK